MLNEVQRLREESKRLSARAEPEPGDMMDVKGLTLKQLVDKDEEASEAAEKSAIGRQVDGQQVKDEQAPFRELEGMEGIQPACVPEILTDTSIDGLESTESLIKLLFGSPCDAPSVHAGPKVS